MVLILNSPPRTRTRSRPRQRVEGGFGITHTLLDLDATVPGLDPAKFLELAEGAKRGCPISKALAATAISLKVNLH